MSLSHTPITDGFAVKKHALEGPECREFVEARHMRDMELQHADMLAVIRRTWIKLNCGIDNEPDSAIADSCWDQICNVMGTDEAIKWADGVTPDED